MARKTAGVEQLVQEVLDTISQPYGEDIIEDVCLAIEANPQWMTRYRELRASFAKDVANNWIGQYTKSLTGMKTIRVVDAKRATIIKYYTKLSH